LSAAFFFGLGTAMVYPSPDCGRFDASQSERGGARSLSVYRFWRDLGYGDRGRFPRVSSPHFRNGVGDRDDCCADFSLGTVFALVMREKTRGGLDVAQSIEFGRGVQPG